MITFKQYLQENILHTKPDRKSIKAAWASTLLQSKADLDKALAAHCSKNIKERKIWRGFSDSTFKSSEAGYILDVSGGNRVSRSSNNAYNVIMALAPAFKDVPDRHSSISATTQLDTALGYGLNMNRVARVVPFDGTTIAWVVDANDEPAVDVLYNLTHPKFMGVKFESMNQLSMFIGVIAEYFGVSSRAEKSLDVELFRKTASELAALRIDDELAAGYVACAAFYYVAGVSQASLHPNGSPDSEQYIKWNKWRGAFPHQPLPDVVDPDAFILKDDYETLFNWVSKHPDPIMDAVNVITPEMWNIKTSTNPSDIPRGAECWFSGKSIIIPTTTISHDKDI